MGEGKREGEYLKGDEKQEDVVIVMEGKVEEKLKIEVKIEGEESLRKIGEGSLIFRPKIVEIVSKVDKEGVEVGEEYTFSVDKPNIFIGDGLAILREFNGAILKKVDGIAIGNEEEKVNVGVGTFKLTYEVTVNDKKYEEIVEVRVEEMQLRKKVAMQ